MIINEKLAIDVCKKLKMPLIILNPQLGEVYKNISYIKLSKLLDYDISDVINTMIGSNTLNSECEKENQCVKVNWKFIKSNNDNILITANYVNKKEKLLQQLFNQYIESMPFSFYIKSKDGMYFETNKAHQKEFGKNIIGSTDYNTFKQKCSIEINESDVDAINNKIFLGKETIDGSEYLSIKTMIEDKTNQFIFGASLKFESITYTLFNTFLRKYLSKPNLPKLTPREVDCIELSSQGKTNREISAIFYVSKKTIDFHMDNAKYKLDTYKKNKLTYLFGQFHRSLI